MLLDIPSFLRSRRYQAQCRQAFGSSEAALTHCPPGTPLFSDDLHVFSEIDRHLKITNNVVTTQSANATIALGASPIMATAPEEMADLAAVSGGLLVNFGTIQNLDGMVAAGE